MDTFIERLGNLPNSQPSSGKCLGPDKRISQEQKYDSNYVDDWEIRGRHRNEANKLRKTSNSIIPQYV